MQRTLELSHKISDHFERNLLHLLVKFIPLLVQWLLLEIRAMTPIPIPVPVPVPVVMVLGVPFVVVVIFMIPILLLFRILALFPGFLPHWDDLEMATLRESQVSNRPFGLRCRDDSEIRRFRGRNPSIRRSSSCGGAGSGFNDRKNRGKKRKIAVITMDCRNCW